jgi:DNA ligase (NAD+)
MSYHPFIDPPEIIQLKKWDKLYYEESAPEVSDDEYDSLKESAYEKYPTHPYFKGVGIQPDRKKVKLPYLLGSLSKKKPDGSFNRWNEKYPDQKVASLKLDGVSILVEYDNGYLQKAYTRGDGEYGRDVTEKIKHICPNMINQNEYLAVRGEALLNKDVEYQKFGKNRRAAVSGLINKDSNENIHNVDLVFYEIVEDAGSIWTLNEDQRLNRLFYLFPNNCINWMILNPEITEEDLIFVYSELSNIPYESDGLVVTVYRSERENVKYPEKKIAFKFPNTPIDTVVLDVLYDVGRTGKITPKLSIEPVQISNTTVSFATAHNVAYLRDNQIGTGAKIKIVKSGDVIPYVVSIEEPGDYELLDNCPSCKGPLVWSETKINLFCYNDNCLAKNFYKVGHYVKTMGMEHIGISTLKNLVINSIIELYYLKPENIMVMEGFGEKKAEKIVGEIQNSLHIEPERFLAALGIDGIGRTLSKDILSKYSFDDLFTITKEELMIIEGVGDVLAENLVQGIQENKELYNNLKHLGLTFKERVNEMGGKVYCLTGNGPLPRNNYIQMIVAQGGVFKSGISKKVDILVTNDFEGTSTKMKKAKSYGIEIISYEELTNRLVKE